MAEEMMLENFPLESDEAEDWESEEAFVEADESAEDIGERARRGRQRNRRPYRARGVRGMTVPSPEGPRKFQFPAKLATAAETNRGLASQEIGRRALEGRLDRLETGVRVQQKNDSSVAGIVTLLLGGGLSLWGAIEASRQSAGFTFGKWAGQQSSKIAAVTSVSQLATSGAKLAINGRYHHSGFGVAADAFAGIQLAAFAFGSMYTPKETLAIQNLAALQALQTAGSLRLDVNYVTMDSGNEFETFKDITSQPVFRLVH
jgi:hypothetical protein